MYQNVDDAGIFRTTKGVRSDELYLVGARLVPSITWVFLDRRIAIAKVPDEKTALLRLVGKGRGKGGAAIGCCGGKISTRQALDDDFTGVATRALVELRQADQGYGVDAGFRVDVAGGGE